MNIGWPEGIWIALTVLTILVHAFHDREPRTGAAAIYSFPVAVCNAAIFAALLYWGGFFA